MPEAKEEFYVKVICGSDKELVLESWSSSPVGENLTRNFAEQFRNGAENLVALAIIKRTKEREVISVLLEGNEEDFGLLLEEKENLIKE